MIPMSISLNLRQILACGLTVKNVIGLTLRVNSKPNRNFQKRIETFYIFKSGELNEKVLV